MLSVPERLALASTIAQDIRSRYVSLAQDKEYSTQDDIYEKILALAKTDDKAAYDRLVKLLIDMASFRIRRDILGDLRFAEYNEFKLSSILTAILRCGFGECGELANAAAMELSKKGIPHIGMILETKTKPALHTFILMPRNEKDKIPSEPMILSEKDLLKLNDITWVVDPWLGTCCTIKEFMQCAKDLFSLPKDNSEVVYKVTYAINAKFLEDKEAMLGEVGVQASIIEGRLNEDSFKKLRDDLLKLITTWEGNAADLKEAVRKRTSESKDTQYINPRNKAFEEKIANAAAGLQKFGYVLHSSEAGFFSLSKYASSKQPFGPYADFLCTRANQAPFGLPIEEKPVTKLSS